MPGAPSWLRDYYGSHFEDLNPSVVYEGKTKAVVMLNRKPRTGYSGIGYVLISKTGNHEASSHSSLHEGLASQAHLSSMKAKLLSEDE